mgnify:CR=1 FL=1
MKKVLLTAVVALSTLVASAQFMVVTTYDGDQVENADKITANLGLGYMVNDAFTVGLVQGSPVLTALAVVVDVDAGVVAVAAEIEDGYDAFVRYNIAQVEGAYASLQIPTKKGIVDAGMQIGVGFAFNVWNGLYVEPNYTMPTEKDAEDKRDGSFNLGVSYRF